jgi:hypothetical protein
MIIGHQQTVSAGRTFARWTGCLAFAGVAAAMLGACATTPAGQPAVSAPAAMSEAEKGRFEQDRKAIMAQAGDYRVRFDFIETVGFSTDYRVREPDRSGGYEVVRVIEDRGDFISLQHILVIEAGDQKFPIKHWRQDWRYEPASVLVFIGGNAWENRAVSAADREGSWSQQVYQVEDSPRYGAVGAWTHDNGVSQWTPAAELRPLPRRESTSRKDYYGVLAVNRHALTQDGWVHEQDNSKLAMVDGRKQIIAREVGVNTYRPNADFDASVATNYWAATRDFWAEIRKEWDKLEVPGTSFGLTVQGEPEPVYGPLLELADNIQAGKTTTAEAVVEARAVIAKFTTHDIGTLDQRLAKAAADGAAKTASAAH